MVTARPPGSLGGLGSSGFPDAAASNKDIAVVADSSNVDTPSKWLTFGAAGNGSTPNGGSTTPGTAFGSPFWASLGNAAATTTTNTGGLGSQRASPKSMWSGSKYSPSKELNPFEMSWGAEHDLPSFLSVMGNGNDDMMRGVQGSHASSAASHLMASHAQTNPALRASLKRPFEEAAMDASTGPLRHNSGDSLITGSAADSDSGDPRSRPTHNADGMPSDASLLAIPSWKRPKFSVDSQSSTFGPSPADSPAAGGAHTSPSGDDSVGSPASTQLATPSVNPPVMGIQQHASNIRKSSLNPDQIEAAKLAAPTYSYPAYMPAPATQFPLQAGAHQHQLTQGPPAPLVLPPLSQSQIQQQQFSQQQQIQMLQQQQQHHQRMLSQHQQQQSQQQQAQKQVPQSQQQVPPASRTDSPKEVQAGSPQAAEAPANPNVIPYANGRAPSAQPAQTRRTSRKRAAAQAAAANIAIKSEEMEDDDDDDAVPPPTPASAALSMSTNATGGKGTRRNLSQLNTSGTTTAAAPPTATPTTAGGSKKNAAPVVEKRVKLTMPMQSSFSALPPPGEFDHLSFMNQLDENGDPIDEEEAKRRAFLERNRQAACRSRQKKKEWIGNLENHAAQLQAQNSALTSEIEDLRKELFALRHTLSFHERSGCAAAHAHADKGPHLHPHAQMLQQQQQGMHMHPHHMPHQHPPQPMPGGMHHPSMQSQPPQQQAGLPPAHGQLHPDAPASMQASAQHLQPPPAHLGINARSMPGQLPPHGFAQNHAPMPPHLQPGSSTLAPPVIRPFPQRAQLHPNAPGQLTFAPAQPLQTFLHQHHNNQTLPPAPQQQSASGEITRPGSAGATFGLSTPNFADLFGGAMQNLRTPGAMLRLSPSLPNTFGLSLQDIPVRPLSAPPTPSPMLPGGPNFTANPNQADYFSSKKTTGGHHGASSYLDGLLLSNGGMQAAGIMA